LAADTKIIGLMVWGLCALFVLARQIATRRMNGRAWVSAVLALLSFAGFSYLLTPAMWADPAGYLGYVVTMAMDFTRWQNYVLFRGTVYDLSASTLPRIYLPYMILTTTPLWVLALLLTGQAAALVRFFRRGVRKASDGVTMALWLCTLLWTVPLLYAVLGKPVLYNGWRHFYFLYGPMLALAAYGLRALAVWLKARRSRSLLRVGAALLALCMGLTGAQMAASHARQYTYYNELVQRDSLPDELELDCWNVSVLETLRALAAKLPDSQVAVATVCGAEYGSQSGLEAALALLPQADQARFRLLPAGSAVAEYTLANRTYARLMGWKPTPLMTPAVETRSFGYVICTVYRRDTADAPPADATALERAALN
jgi:hypothetical protein